jgi:hypothetical protein
MNAISLRSTKGFGPLFVLAAALLTGCAATGGAVTTAAGTSRAAAPAVNFAAPPGYIVCAGGHASRFDELEQNGRVCRPVLSLHEIY